MWILLYFVMSQNPHYVVITHSELFQSKAACENALSKMQGLGLNVKGVCVHDGNH